VNNLKVFFPNLEKKKEKKTGEISGTACKNLTNIQTM
jgi:hypothetical protein